MDNQKRITGERLFLLYAGPCIRMRELTGQIKMADARLLNQTIENGTDPSHELLNRCFPEPVKDLGDCLRRFHFADVMSPDLWPLIIVHYFWEEHKGSSPACATKLAVVSGFTQDRVMVVCAGGSKRIVENHYALPIVVGNIVSIHLGWIIEI